MSTVEPPAVTYDTLLYQARDAPLTPPVQQGAGAGAGGAGEDISHFFQGQGQGPSQGHGQGSSQGHSHDIHESMEDYDEPSGFKGLLLRYSAFIKSGALIIALYWLLQQPFFMAYVYKYVPISYQTGSVFTLILGTILALMFLILDEIMPNFVLYFI